MTNREEIKQPKEEMQSGIRERSGEEQVQQSAYPVFPGIELIYHEVSLPKLREDFPQEGQGNVYEITHCREGRFESAAGGQCFYLAPGDLAIHKRTGQHRTASFPTGRYSGISIVVDLDAAPKCFSCLLNDVNVHPSVLMQKFCGEDRLFIARSNEHLEHVFSELYQIPEEVRKGYIKIKVLEIFLFLSCMPAEAVEKRKALSASQAALAKRACDFLKAHIEEKITIADLAQVFHVSPTQLKNCFKGVYGESVYAYIRKVRMQRAADMLLSTDKTVLEIANIHGYDNASKFASAFSDIMGVAPMEYRKENTAFRP